MVLVIFVKFGWVLGRYRMRIESLRGCLYHRLGQDRRRRCCRLCVFPCLFRRKLRPHPLPPYPLCNHLHWSTDPHRTPVHFKHTVPIAFSDYVHN